MENLKFLCGSSPENLRLPKVELLDFNYEFSLFKVNQNLYSFQTAQSGNALKANFNEVEYKDNARNQGLAFENTMNERSPYTFELSLCSDLEEPILKGKYFSFKVELRESGGVKYPAQEIVELEVLIYNSEGVAIKKNMKGQDILRGNYKQNMNYYPPDQRLIAYFRIQICEVSSHYINKSINLVVKARNSEFLNQKGWNIKPIIIENIIVRAKKSI